MQILGMQDDSVLDSQLRGFPCHLFSQARDKRGLSQKEVARDLHLTSKIINALEENDFDIISSPVFTRGYIKSYGRYLGLDTQALVAEFDALYGMQDHNKKLRPSIHQLSEQSKSGGFWVKLILFVFVLGLVAATVVWWQSQNGGLML